ncbi:MAG: PaaX family transcriptional regulator [Neomegalonema sp.]|nr:PaaX family transcriptional regulator [Neomegalonema sp.]
MPHAAIAALVDAFPLRAGGFIVTLYGDVVAPRGGGLWMGNVIEACAAVGVNESRVRTAVSRLVAAGRLEGLKDGRKSYYRLTNAGEIEFERAAERIYREPIAAPVRGWRIVLLPQGAQREALMEQLSACRFGFPQPGVAILPDRGDPLPDIAAPSFLAASDDDLTEVVRAAWPLEELHARIELFFSVFEPLEKAPPAPENALAARLMLVHAFREIALSDPRLPLEFLPANWRGPAARALFARLYLALSPAADAAIGKFQDQNGQLRLDAAAIASRMEALGGE